MTRTESYGGDLRQPGAALRGLQPLVLVIAALLMQLLTGCGELSTPQIPFVRPVGLSYADSAMVYVTGQPIIPNTPRVHGGEVESFSIAPSLPLGLTIDPKSGVISGTPASASPATIYTVKATNVRGSAIGRIQIEVTDHVIAPDSLRYPLQSAIYMTGQAIPPNVPIATGGEITQFTIAPGLPPGLSIDAQTGAIAGTPSTPQPATTYTVTGANAAGSVQTTISIAVQPPPLLAPATVSYDDAVYVVGQPIVPNVPTLTGGAPTQFSVNPPLPDGLDLDSVTGVISGAPSTVQAATPFKVTASNAAGQAQTTLTLTVTTVGVWTPSGSLNEPRAVHTASLRPDGTVLVAAGFSSSSALSSTEVRTQAGIWMRAQPMATRRFLHTSTTLQDGRVLVVAGVGTSGNGLASAEIFDTQWTATPPMTTSHFHHTATLLNDGRVLVAGGGDPSGYTAVAEVYDPGTGNWTPVASLNTARASHTATRLADGRVLIAGGDHDSGDTLAAAEIYDPIANTWTTLPAMSQPRTNHTASLLADGSVLVAGGNNNSGTPLDQAELFNPQTVSWQPLPPMKNRRDSHTATVMPNGQVVVAGGSGVANVQLSSVEIFDPASRQWLPAASLASGRTAYAATLLPDGRLLVVGGKGANYLASSEVFDISQSGSP